MSHAGTAVKEGVTHTYHAAVDTAGQGVQQAKELASQYLRFAFILFPTSYLLSLSLSPII